MDFLLGYLWWVLWRRSPRIGVEKKSRTTNCHRTSEEFAVGDQLGGKDDVFGMR
jgi:hypothetical protein